MPKLHPSLAARGDSPLLVQVLLRDPQIGWPLARLSVALLTLLGMASLGFGSLSGGWTTHGNQMGLLAGFVLAWGLSPVLRNLATARRHREVDWTPGHYLFEAGLIDGTQPGLPRISLSELTRIRVLRHDPSAGRGFGGLALHFEGGGRILLPVRGGDAAERLGEQVRELAGRAPVWKPGPERLTLQGPLWPMLAAGLLGLVLGLGMWAYRDRLSDDLAFESAWPSEGSGGLRLYLRNVDGRHAASIREHFLPEAAFAEASEQNSMKALLEWRAEFGAPQQTMRFEDGHARLYSRARADLALLESRGGALEQSRRASLSALLDIQEAAGSPPLALRFAPGATRWLDELDAALAGTHDGRPVARAGDHVKGIPIERRRRHLADSIEEGVQLLLGVRVFSLEPGEGAVPAGRPGLWVNSSVQPGTSVFEAEGQESVFVELQLHLELELSVPGADPVLLDLALHSPDVFAAPERPERSESAAALIYEAMLRRVMDGLSLAFVEAFGGAGVVGEPAAETGPP